MKITIEAVDAADRKVRPDDNNLGFGKYFTDHMFVMEYDAGEGWHDARIVSYGDFSFDPAAMALHYGQAIFEGLKAYRDPGDGIRLFRPLDNLGRMNRSAVRMCMPEFDTETVLEGCESWSVSMPTGSLGLRGQASISGRLWLPPRPVSGCVLPPDISFSSF